MAYHTFPPPFYPGPYTPSASYSTIPPPSPNPYGCGYLSYYNHEQQPPLPYSQPQPPPPPYSPFPSYCQPPPYQPIGVIQRSFAEILQTSQRSLEEFTQICQKSKNDLRASNELIKASLNSIKESFEAFCKQEHFQQDEEDPQEPSEMLQVQLQEELVDEETEDLKVETETFTVEGTPPKTAVDLTQLSTEATNSQEQQRNLRNAARDDKSSNPAPSSPRPKPPKSHIVTGRNRSLTSIEFMFTRSLAVSPPLELPNANSLLAPPPKPPDPSFQKADSTITPPPPKPTDRKWRTSVVDTQLTHYTIESDPSLLDRHCHTQRPFEPSDARPSQKNNLLEIFPAFLHQSLDKCPKPLDLQRLTKAQSVPLNKSTICVLPASTNQSAARFPPSVPSDAYQEIDKASFVDMLPAGYLTFPKVHPPLYDLQRLDEMKSPPFVQNIAHLNFLQGTNFCHVVPFDSRTPPTILPSSSILPDIDRQFSPTTENQRYPQRYTPQKRHHVPSLIAATVTHKFYGTHPFNLGASKSADLHSCAANHFACSMPSVYSISHVAFWTQTYKKKFVGILYCEMATPIDLGKNPGASSMHPILKNYGDTFPFINIDVVAYKQWDPGKKKNLQWTNFRTLRTRFKWTPRQ